MCGIAGVWDRALSADRLHAIAAAMSARLAHRGPDDSGVWTDRESSLALGHRRLSILDLSPTGHQPMISPRGRFVITYNGEVYNYRELRRELEQCGHRFAGGSDTEVILGAFEEWGIEPALDRFIGMFAFALWDRAARVLHLVRDRLGIKPLYFGWAANALVFASELKGLRGHPAIAPALGDTAARSFLCYGYVPAPLSICRGIYKLLPGCILSISRAELDCPDRVSAFPERTEYPVRPRRYWSAREVVERDASAYSKSSETEACERLEALVRDSVRMRMLADVPVGAFFSGGIDSSLVVALMQSQSGRPVRTFTVSFEDQECDEG